MFRRLPLIPDLCWEPSQPGENMGWKWDTVWDAGQSTDDFGPFDSLNVLEKEDEFIKMIRFTNI